MLTFTWRCRSRSITGSVLQCSIRSIKSFYKSNLVYCAATVREFQHLKYSQFLFARPSRLGTYMGYVASLTRFRGCHWSIIGSFTRLPDAKQKHWCFTDVLRLAASRCQEEWRDVAGHRLSELQQPRACIIYPTTTILSSHWLLRHLANHSFTFGRDSKVLTPSAIFQQALDLARPYAT